MNIEDIISSQIKNEIEALADKLRQELKQEFITSSTPWLSRRDAAVYLGVSLSSIDNYVKWGQLEKYKIDSNTRFKRADLDKLLY
jgi:excisionase family DNA binding protein